MPAGVDTVEPCWSDICAGAQSLWLLHNKQVVHFRCQSPRATRTTTALSNRTGSKSLWAGGLLHSGTVQLPDDIQAVSLSPDGKFAAALRVKLLNQAEFDAGLPMPTPMFSALVHVDLAHHGHDPPQHMIVKQFKQSIFEPKWAPCQVSAEQRLYMLTDGSGRFHFCDCHRHCVLRIIDCQPEVLDTYHPCTTDPWVFFMEDGRSVVMRGHEARYRVHVLTWRALPQAAQQMEPQT